MSDGYDAADNGKRCYDEGIAAMRAKHLGVERVVHIGNHELILGDCLEVMPKLGKFDAVVTDPPYGIGFKYNTHDDDAEAYPAFMRDVVAASEQLCPVGPKVFWQGMLQADKWHRWFPTGFRMFAACKGFVQYRPIGVQYAWDPVIFWGKNENEPRADRKDWHAQMLAPFGAGRERISHPCPRPLGQVRYVVEAFSIDAQTILDPFMGSGTTGVACEQLGRHFTGIELDPEYFEIAVKRVRKAYAQPTLFEAEPKPKPPENGNLFTD